MLSLLLALCSLGAPLTSPAGLVDRAAGPLVLSGTCPSPATVSVVVTTDRGQRVPLAATVTDGAWRAPWRGPLPLGWLAVDVTAGDARAESMVIIHDSRQAKLPDLPSAFTTDLLDAAGRVDAQSTEWPAIRAALNLYMNSRGAKLAGVGRAGFDLANPADLAWYRDNMALYDMRHRDREWATPLGNRPRRSYWNSVWRTWFNPSNDHPLDGNPKNNDHANYLPYAFANDYADLLIAQVMRRRADRVLDDNLSPMLGEATENLLAMQHRQPTNFSLRDTHGVQHTYTAGAFRYGLFENGDWLTEGKGWFYNPAFNDYYHGGVLNGRCLWACGEALAADPAGPLAARLRDAIALGARFCLRDALAPGYAKRTGAGRVYWRDAGEHAYLAVGLVAAARVAPATPLDLDPAVDLRTAAGNALDALVDLLGTRSQWSVYPNVDSMAIVALADGALAWPADPRAAAWQRAAMTAADGWLAAKAPDYPAPLVHFGPRIKPDQMTFNWGHLSGKPETGMNTVYLYQTGHWLHALARLLRLTGEARYRDRCQAMVRYLCGDNPMRARLLNETGGVYNWVDDRDKDGVEDTLKYDMYPESTAFCQIGLGHLVDALEHRP
ncbi:MAG: hypothetical protein HZB16_19785 [Armatimonadetes bacterium]|nr:hypothetical protein [Armatimonadota bacterium]